MATNQSLTVSGLILQDLFQHEDEKGKVRHFMRSGFTTFKGFGEVYFSTVHHTKVKGWKKHCEMTMNITVVNGEVKLVIYDDRTTSKSYKQLLELQLTAYKPQLLTVPPGLWVAFQGIHPDQTNILANFADIEHKPQEAINIPIDSPSIPYKWSS